MGLGDSINLGVSQSIQSIANAASLSLSLNNNISTIVPLPWVNTGVDSKFFHYINVDPSRWDQLFPYRLLVVDVSNNQIVFGSNGGQLTSEVSIQYSNGTGSALITYLAPTSVWVFQLPISPQQLNIQDNYAIQTTATLRGVMEEHSGVRFKMITAQGTLGVWPQRSSVTKPPTPPSVLQSIFGGTITAASNLANQVSSLVNTATNGTTANPPVSLRPETSTFGTQSTGYYQALKLQQFLEQYAEAKRNPANANWRLVFDIPKQNQSFVVTPVSYSWQQSKDRPMEFLFNFQLKAWRRIDLQQTATPIPPSNQPITPNILQRILNTMNQTQQVLSASLNLIGAVRSDILTPIIAAKNIVAYVKSVAGVAATMADLPLALQQNLQSPAAAYISANATSLASANTDPATLSNVRAIQSTSNQNEGLSQAAVTGGQLGPSATIFQSLNPTNAIFTNPAANFLLLDQLPVNALSLNNSQQAAIQNALTQASETTVAQLKQYRATLLQLALQLSNNFGTGSAYYNQIYNLPPPTPRILPINLNEYDIIDSLYEAIAATDILTATTYVDNQAILDNMQFVAGLATTTGINFEVPNSKIYVPVPFGLTIEGIAARYLGDPERWIEIATLNNLKEPYIDENGFQLSLLSNGSGRQIFVGDNTDLYVGQTVILNSTIQAQSPRTILDIAQLSSSSFILTLDGLANLNLFTTQDLAYIQVYLPGTVNSQQKLFIPSDISAPPISSTIIPPPSTASDPLTALSGVDILLTDTGDIALSQTDMRYSSGITNLIQALKIKFGSQAGTIITDPNFGLNIKAGQAIPDVQIQQLYDSINQMITDDPRFAGVSKLQLLVNGPVLGISMSVQLPNNSGVLPVTFALTAQ